MEKYAPDIIEAPILCGEEEITLKLRPMTYGRIIEISDLCGQDFSEVVKPENLTPLNAAKVAYCLMPQEQRAKFDEIKLDINGEEQQANGATKFYYLLTEQNVVDGQTNMNSVMNAVYQSITNGFPSADKKKAKRINRKIIIQSTLKKLLTFLRVNTGRIPTEYSLKR